MVRMELQVVQNYLRQFPVFEVLNNSEFDALTQMCKHTVVAKHNYVYLSDEPSTYFCLLVKGTIKTGIHSVEGREVIKSIQHPFTFFGELGLVGEQNRSEFACVMNQEVHYLSVKISDFRELMNKNYALSQIILQSLGNRLRKAERQWESLILKDVRSRILEFLKESADARGRQVGYETMVKHGLTQQDIANLVGASRQTVTAILNELKKSNVIYFNRNTILIRDMAKLN